MGKGKKTNVVAAIQQSHRAGELAVDSKKGCNCPIGCVVGESIPAGAHKLPEGAVKTVCSNENCPAMPYQHAACYEKWEEFLADGVKRQQGSYRQQPKASIKRELWDRRMAPLIVRLSTCPACHGHIRRAVHDERAEQVWRVAAQIARNPQPPPAANRNNNNNRNRVPPAAAATTALPHQPAKRPPIVNKAPPRVNADDQPKMVVPYYLTLPRLPPASADTHQAIHLPQGRKSPTRVDANDLQEFPTLRIDVWEPVTRAKAVELRAARVVNSSSAPENDQSAIRPSPSFDPNNLTGAQLIGELEDAVKAFSELWIAHEIVRDLLDRLDVRVMEEIANAGGLEQWLCDNSSTLVIRKNRIVLKSDSVPVQLKSFGNVTRILSRTGDTGIIFAEAYDTMVFFNVADCIIDGCTTYFEDDIVSFKAEKVVESAWHGCKWQAVFLELIQREERAAASASTRAKQMEQTERCWSSTATAVKSSTDVHYNIEDESLFMMKKSDGAPVPFDIESIIARTPYLQIRPVANTKNITSSSVAAVRRIPMATVTPDDFHPSATASSSPGPLQTSSPLLPADIDALPDTFGKVLSDFSNRSSCDTPLSFDVEKCQKTATSVTESMSLVDELTAASGCEFSLDAWLTLDKSIEDNHNYAACSKEIKELVQLFS